MKRKTLAIALGALAAAAAGAPAAQAAAAPDVSGALGTVTSTLPVGEAAQTLPAPAGDLAAKAAPVAGQATGLLGGLPVGPAGALPAL
ncbi:hypothetical protein GCM10017562_43170 [Streptomyces roseofulvus]|uniref:ATP-binding protein n=2 Tax=Streptomyces TaxID=1883 RepID=A0ABU4KDR8_9ACTN|nr:ATP-binding protein [Streptomyces roseolus]MDX2295905.1 ATP-binding protein [Streptomyces roseolus]